MFRFLKSCVKVDVSCVNLKFYLHELISNAVLTQCEHGFQYFFIIPNNWWIIIIIVGCVRTRTFFSAPMTARPFRTFWSRLRCTKRVCAYKHLVFLNTEAGGFGYSLSSTQIHSIAVPREPRPSIRRKGYYENHHEQGSFAMKLRLFSGDYDFDFYSQNQNWWSRPLLIFLYCQSDAPGLTLRYRNTDQNMFSSFDGW